jgi:hypothetical protein
VNARMVGSIVREIGSKCRMVRLGIEPIKESRKGANHGNRTMESAKKPVSK